MLFDTIQKAGLNGITSGLATTAWFGSGARVYLGLANSEVPLYLLAFSAGATGSIMGDIAHSFIFDDVDISEKWKHRTSLITGITINAGLFVGLLCFYDKKVCDDFGWMLGAGVGGLSELVGSGVYSNLKENLYL